MNFNVYLPDDIGQQAKDLDLKLSQLLRKAVIRELRRRSKLDAALGEPQVYEFEINDDPEESYTALIRGKQVLIGVDGEVYLTTDKRVIFCQNPDLYDGVWDYHVLEAGWSESELIDFLREHTRIDFAPACKALGVRPVVEL